MKCILGRWKEDGTPVIPLYNGEDTIWYYVRKLDDGTTEKVPVAAPPERVAIAVNGGWQITGYWFNDDGSSPDPRPHKNIHAPFVRRGLHLEFEHPRTKLRIDSEDLPRHIESWVQDQTEGIRRCVAALGEVGMACSEEHQTCAEVASGRITNPFDCGEDVLV